MASRRTAKGRGPLCIISCRPCPAGSFPRTSSYSCQLLQSCAFFCHNFQGACLCLVQRVKSGHPFLCDVFHFCIRGRGVCIRRILSVLLFRLPAAFLAAGFLSAFCLFSGGRNRGEGTGLFADKEALQVRAFATYSHSFSGTGLSFEDMRSECGNYCQRHAAAGPGLYPGSCPALSLS